MDIKAGPRDRAGFIDAPQIGPAKIASSATTEPTTTPAISVCLFVDEETRKITNIKMNVNKNSRINDCVSLPAGSVAPSVSCEGKSMRRVKLANMAPVH